MNCFRCWLPWLVALSPLSVDAAPPAEVGPGLQFAADKITLQWDPVVNASAYNVYRGTTPNGTDARCLVFRTVQSAATDTALPATLFTYLVSAYNPDGEGSLGNASDGMPRSPLVRCTDDDLDGVRDDQDNCPGLANPLQADQDDNFVGDACDPQTYSFETDTLGARPAAMTSDGGVDPSFVVRSVGTDRAVSYDGDATPSAVLDRFDRLSSQRPQQDFDLYVDTAGAVGDMIGIEFWADADAAERAGNAVRLRFGQGKVALYDRRGDLLTLLQEAPLTDLARLRLHVRKQPGPQTQLLIDKWDGANWVPTGTTLSIADDHRFRGTTLGLTDDGGGGRLVTRLTRVPLWSGGSFELLRQWSTLDDWKLVQRGPNGTADLDVAFQYRAAAEVRLELAVVSAANGAPLPGFDFNSLHYSLNAAPQGAFQQVTVPAVPQGGNYHLQARWVQPSNGAVLGSDQIVEIAVGDVFLAAGQSNMSGYSGVLDPVESPIDEVHLFGNDYRWQRAREPMDDGFEQVDRVSEEAPQHTLMLRFAKSLRAALGVPIAIVPAPLGGTNLFSQWQRLASDPTNRGTLYGSSIHRVLLQGYDQPIRGALWYQGESDAGRGTDLYLADLRRLVTQWRTDLAAPQLFFGNCQLSNCQNNDFETWLPIQEAQRRYALEDANSCVVGLVDLGRSDTIHLNVDGYKTAGQRLAQCTLNGSYALPQTLGPRLLQARFQSGRRDRVELVFDKPMQGGLPQLFRVLEFNTPVQILSQTTNAGVVTLQLQRNSSANNTFVSYGYSHAAGGPTWLIAQDGSGPALAFYKIKVQ